MPTNTPIRDEVPARESQRPAQIHRFLGRCARRARRQRSARRSRGPLIMEIGRQTSLACLVIIGARVHPSASVPPDKVPARLVAPLRAAWRGRSPTFVVVGLISQAADAHAALEISCRPRIIRPFLAADLYRLHLVDSRKWPRRRRLSLINRRTDLRRWLAQLAV